jgi:hypothetical protein
VGGPDEVAAKCLDLVEDHRGIRIGIAAPEALGDLLVEVDPFQENRFAVEQQVATLGLDAAEADLVCQKISARGNRCPVELGRRGLP